MAVMHKKDSLNMSFTAVLNYLTSPVGIFILWITLHFIAPHLYVYFCTPATAIGFLISPLIATAPHCMAFRWIIYNGGTMITTMWMVIGGWFIRKLVNREIEHQKRD
jgi:hypothetical protein